VEDVLSADNCVCRTDKGHLVEGVKESMLETVIPRGDGDRVMVVRGPHAGKVRGRLGGGSPLCSKPPQTRRCSPQPSQVGRIVDRQQARNRVTVQLQHEEAGRAVELDYDAVCHYVGGREDK
ncbi:GPKOW protein, partial [Piaya cayana]|nr:GPKOW protein [Piaya cayana]